LTCCTKKNLATLFLVPRTKRQKEKLILSGVVKAVVSFLREFFRDLFSFFKHDHAGSHADDDDLRWNTAESGDFLRQTG
jgi:hypothetical protein